MAKHALYDTEVGAALKQVRGEGVSEGVWADRFLQSRLLGQFLDDMKHGDARHAFPEMCAHEQIIFMSRFDVYLGTISHVIHNLGYRAFGDWHQTLLVTLALYFDEALIQIEVREFQITSLRYAQTAAV